MDDLRRARASGCAVACMSCDYNHRRDIRGAGPDAVIDSLADLPTVLVDG